MLKPNFRPDPDESLAEVFINLKPSKNVRKN